MIIHLAYTKAWGGARVCNGGGCWAVGLLCRSLVVQEVVVQRVCSAESLGGRALVVSRLALRWGAERPRPRHCSASVRRGGQVLGLLRSPTRGKPARHKKAGSPLSTKSWLSTTRVCSAESLGGQACGEQACPALGREAALTQAVRCFSQKTWAGFRWPGPCGEQACPALGREAALTPGTAVLQLEGVGRFWGCCAAQRGASPLATKKRALHRPLKAGCPPRGFVMQRVWVARPLW